MDATQKTPSHIAKGMPLYKAWDIEGGCFIPKELFAVTGEGKILTRNSEEDPWMEEEIPIKLSVYFKEE